MRKTVLALVLLADATAALAFTAEEEAKMITYAEVMTLERLCAGPGSSEGAVKMDVEGMSEYLGDIELNPDFARETNQRISAYLEIATVLAKANGVDRQLAACLDAITLFGPSGTRGKGLMVKTTKKGG